MKSFYSTKVWLTRGLYVIIKLMKSFVKPIVALSVAAALVVFSVFCCCTLSALQAQLKKVSAKCGHCPQKADQHGCDTPGDCQHQLVKADSSAAKIMVSSTAGGSVEHAPVYLHAYQISLFPKLSSGSPPGHSAARLNFTPLYLRTFHLRI